MLRATLRNRPVFGKRTVKPENSDLSAWNELELLSANRKAAMRDGNTSALIQINNQISRLERRI